MSDYDMWNPKLKTNKGSLINNICSVQNYKIKGGNPSQHDHPRQQSVKLMLYTDTAARSRPASSL